MVRNKIVEEYHETLKELQSVFPKAKLTSARGHELHIRVTNAYIKDIEQFYSQFSGKLDGTLQDKRYSTSYLTHFVELNNKYIPIVFSCGEYKVNNKDSIVQKQLTPNKLDIIGEYTDTNTLLTSVEKALSILNPQLSSVWSAYSDKELKKLLVKLAYNIVYKNQTFNKRERELIKAHKASLGKDFGEVLSAIYILHKEKNVHIALSESSTSFDLSFLDEYGIINKFNTKSGAGSGQTFKSVKNEFLSF